MGAILMLQQAQGGMASCILETTPVLWSFTAGLVSSVLNARTHCNDSGRQISIDGFYAHWKLLSAGHHPTELAAHADLLPGKTLDVPLAKPVLWTPTARFMTIALGAATALAVMGLACCTCWFLGFFERVPVKREDDPPVFSDTPEKEKPLAVKVKEVGENATDEEAYIIA